MSLVFKSLLASDSLTLQFHLLLHPLLFKLKTVIFAHQLSPLSCHLNPDFLDLSGQPLVSRLTLHQLYLQLTLARARLNRQLLVALSELAHLESLLVYQLVLLAEVVPQVPHLEGHQLHALLVLRLQPQVLGRPLVQLLLQELLSLGSQPVNQFVFF